MPPTPSRQRLARWPRWSALAQEWRCANLPVATTSARPWPSIAAAVGLGARSRSRDACLTEPALVLGALQASTSRRALLDVSRGVVDGIAHVRKRQPAARALMLMAGHRLLYGVATVMGILLFRNNFFADDLDLAFAGLGVAVVAAGAGVLVAAAVTPWSTRRWGTRGWMTMALMVAPSASSSLD